MRSGTAGPDQPAGVSGCAGVAGGCWRGMAMKSRPSLDRFGPPPRRLRRALGGLPPDEKWATVGTAFPMLVLGLVLWPWAELAWLQAFGLDVPAVVRSAGHSARGNPGAEF